MPRQYNQLSYNAGQFRFILNMCQMSRSEFARLWSVGRNVINTWVMTNAKIKQLEKTHPPISEHACRLAKATFDRFVLEVENHIMRDIMLYKRPPKRPRLALQHGVSTALVSIAIKNLHEVGILKTRHNPANYDENMAIFKEDYVPEEAPDYEVKDHISVKIKQEDKFNE